MKIKSTSFYIGLSIILFVLPYAAFAYRIINAHEHIANVAQADRVIPLMDKFGVSQTILVGSPRQTFGFVPKNVKPRSGTTTFTDPDKNNRALLRIKKKYPDRFLVFCVFWQEDPRMLQKTKACVKKGATGVKLFSGHGNFHTIPLNDPSLEDFYTYLEEHKIPIVWHVNSGKYLEELEVVLESHPSLKIVCPHYCMASKSRGRLTALLTKYPQLFFDISFGAFVEEGLKTVTEASREFHEIFMNYPDRFFFGTDYVFTKIKTDDGIRENFRKYRALLEETLNLPEAILEKIYGENWKVFMAL